MAQVTKAYIILEETGDTIKMTAAYEPEAPEGEKPEGTVVEITEAFAEVLAEAVGKS